MILFVIYNEIRKMKNFSIFGDYEYSADALKIERKNSSINFQFNKSIQEEVVEELIEF